MTHKKPRNVSQLIVECLEAEGVEYVFGIPGEENLHLMDALLDSTIRFITTRHEQGASFMADMYGRLTGRPACAWPRSAPAPSTSRWAPPTPSWTAIHWWRWRLRPVLIRILSKYPPAEPGALG